MLLWLKLARAPNKTLSLVSNDAATVRVPLVPVGCECGPPGTGEVKAGAVRVWRAWAALDPRTQACCLAAAAALAAVIAAVRELRRRRVVSRARRYVADQVGRSAPRRRRPDISSEDRGESDTVEDVDRRMISAACTRAR